jgi:hypothetical protein
MPDLDLREWAMMAPIAAAVLWMGVYPESFLAPMRQDIAALDARIARAGPRATPGSVSANPPLRPFRFPRMRGHTDGLVHLAAPVRA